MLGGTLPIITCIALAEPWGSNLMGVHVVRFVLGACGPHAFQEAVGLLHSLLVSQH